MDTKKSFGGMEQIGEPLALELGMDVERNQSIQRSVLCGGEFHAADGNPASNFMAWDGNQWYNPFPKVLFHQQVNKLEDH
ncbi:MAG: hypothetical protein IPN95_11000 [Bacteroidetes bacterium]|nr:hypothetical protein [Bacteroidota bacterium]